MLRRFVSRITNREKACVPIALEAMFGRYYENQEEVEELFLEFDAGWPIKYLSLLEEYVPVYIFNPSSWDYNAGDNENPYATFYANGIRYRMSRYTPMIVVYDTTRLGVTYTHAECMFAGTFLPYIESGKYSFYCEIFMKHGLIIDRDNRGG